MISQTDSCIASALDCSDHEMIERFEYLSTVVYSLELLDSNRWCDLIARVFKHDI